jgi:predicted amidohydrolase YtcJ
MQRVGEERSRWLYPVKTLLDAGLPVAGSSDAPVVPDVNPLLGIRTAVMRQAKNGQVVAQEERLSVAEAVTLYTTHAAYACGTEHFVGSLRVGNVADLVVLGDDPLHVNLAQLTEIPVEMVVLNGKVQFS